MNSKIRKNKRALLLWLFSGFLCCALVFLLWPLPSKAQHPQKNQAFLKQKQRPHLFFKGKKFLRIAHRGASGHFPPNTMLAFRRALLPPYNADVLEFDLRLTKDKVVVVFHDKNLKRVTGLERELNSLSLKEIKSLDAAYNFSPHYFPQVKRIEGASPRQRYPYRGKGIAIPTLEEVFRSFPRQLMLLEAKSKQNKKELLGEIWRLIQKYKREDKTMLASFSHESLSYFRSLSRGKVATGASRREAFHYLFRCYLFASACESAFDALQIPQWKKLASFGFDLASPKLIDFAHQNGILVHYWTVNDRADMRKLIANGADGIISDFLDRLPEN